MFMLAWVTQFSTLILKKPPFLIEYTTDGVDFYFKDLNITDLW